MSVAYNSDMKRKPVGAFTEISSQSTKHPVETIVDTAQELYDAAYTDKLTGISNRAGLEKAVEKLTHTHAGERAAVVLLDLDGFKGLNDTFGHKIGDEALAVIAGGMSEAFRRQDEIVARLGGDEFVIVLPISDTADGKRAEVTHESLQEYVYDVLSVMLAKIIGKGDVDRSYLERIDFSVGVEIFDVNELRDIEAGEMLEVADKRMYEHKAEHKASP